MSEIVIPPAALEAGARACFRVGFERDPDPEDDFDEKRLVFCRNYARAAFVAMVKAWEGMHTHEWQRPWLGGMSGTDLILPLTQTQEDGDA